MFHDTAIRLLGYNDDPATRELVLRLLAEDPAWEAALASARRLWGRESDLASYEDGVALVRSAVQLGEHLADGQVAAAAELAAVREVFASRWLGMGPVTHTFEQRLQEFLGAKHVVAVNTGTSALHIALEVPDIHAALKTAVARGHFEEKKLDMHIGRNRKWQLNLFDPDGTRAELMEPRTQPQ